MMSLCRLVSPRNGYEQPQGLQIRTQHFRQLRPHICLGPCPRVDELQHELRPDLLGPPQPRFLVPPPHLLRPRARRPTCHSCRLHCAGRASPRWVPARLPHTDSSPPPTSSYACIYRRANLSPIVPQWSRNPRPAFLRPVTRQTSLVDVFDFYKTGCLSSTSLVL